MNALERATLRNTRARLFDRDSLSGTRRGYIKINAGNTLNHELAKFLICWKLLHENKDFVTEAGFGNKKGIADVVNLDEGVIYEIMDSEKMKSIEEKRVKYPLMIETIDAKLEVCKLFVKAKVKE